MKMPPVSPAALETFLRLLPSDPGVASRKMFGQPAAFVDGKMFFGVFGKDIFVRLSDGDVVAARKLPGSKPFEPMPGRAMRNYVVLPPAVLSNARSASVWVDKALRHTRTIAGKPARSK